MTPWIITGALAVVAVVVLLLCIAQRSEIMYLRSRLAEKHNHERRIERVQAGLSEQAIEIEPPDIPTPGVQSRIDAAIGNWEGGATQEQKRSDVRAWRKEGREWAWIAKELEEDFI